MSRPGIHAWGTVLRPTHPISPQQKWAGEKAPGGEQRLPRLKRATFYKHCTGMFLIWNKTERLLANVQTDKWGEGWLLHSQRIRAPEDSPEPLLTRYSIFASDTYISASLTDRRRRKKQRCLIIMQLLTLVSGPTTMWGPLSLSLFDLLLLFLPSC